MGDYVYQQCSGVRCQVSATESDPLLGVVHEMDFLSPGLTFIKRTTRNRNRHSIPGIPAVNAKGLQIPASNTET